MNIWNATTLETVMVKLPWVALDLKVYLQGAWDAVSGNMYTTLRDSGWLPLRHLYGELFQAQPDSMPPNIVDWVLVELRDAQDSTIVVGQRVGWLRKDGRIIDPEGGDGLAIMAKPGFYYISVRHRNHLPIMTAFPVNIIDWGVNPYDFTSSAVSTLGLHSQVEIQSGLFAMYAGDVNQDGKISYQGPENDREVILEDIGTVDPSLILSGYHAGDLNLDGRLQYSGNGNDRAVILRNLGGDQPHQVLISVVPGD